MASTLMMDASKQKNRVMRDEITGELITESKEERERKRQAVLSKYREFKFPEREKARLMELYGTVCVRDFGDDYHKTEEQKRSEFELYDMYKPIANGKTKYTNLEAFIKIWRDIFKFIQAMAKRNRLIMPEKKFIKGVLNGKIEIAGLRFPKYKGRDRKELNWKLVAKYVLDDSLDINDLIQKPAEIEYLPKDVADNPVAHLHEYFSDEQIKQIFRSGEFIDGKYVIDDSKRMPRYIKKATEKQHKKFEKVFKELKPMFRKMQMKNLEDRSLRSFAFAYDLTAEAYDFIHELDKARGFFTEDELPKFNGNINSKKEYKKYMKALDDWADEHQRVQYHGQFISLGEYKEAKLRDELDAAGWNIMKIYDNQEKSDAEARRNRKLKKREKRLQKELSQIQERRELMKVSKGKMINTKKKKKDKKKEKLKKGFGDFLASASGTGYNDWDEYEQNMMNLSWDYKPGMV